MTEPGEAPPAGVVSYHLPGDWRVFAGKTDAANEALSLRFARPGDLWFHIRGMPGSHVVLRVPEDRAPEKRDVELAASVAAYHSKARAAGTVPVSCTDARFVSKPKGAKPGTVAITRERVVKVRPATEEQVAAWRAPSGRPA